MASRAMRGRCRWPIATTRLPAPQRSLRSPSGSRARWARRPWRRWAALRTSRETSIRYRVRPRSPPDPAGLPGLVKPGLGFLGGPDLRSLVEIGRAAEEAGFESLWHAETRITRDSVTALTALAMETRRVRLGSAAINVYTRGAVLTAITWAALAEAAPGRVVLGIGPGSPDPLAQQGFEFEFPVSRLREYVASIRATWHEPVPVTLEGRHHRLSRLMPEVRPAQPVPIYLCVTGPRALDCAEQVADGVVLNAFMPASYTRRSIVRLDAAAGGQD